MILTTWLFKASKVISKGREEYLVNKGIIYTAIKNRKITLFIFATFIFLGLYSYYITPKQEAPDLNPPYAMLTAVYPGASPKEVENLVTSKIEDKVSELDAYDYSTSESRNSLSVVVLRLDIDADTDKSWSVLRQKMDDLQAELPEECQEIKINTDVTKTAGIIISMSGDNFSYEELAGFAEEFKNELNKIEGITQFEITGKQEKEVKIDVDIQKLNYYKLSLEDVTNIIKTRNVNIPSGNLKNDKIKINVNTSGDYSSLKDVENTIITISSETGGIVRLKDIADVYMGLEDSNYKIKQNGKNAVLLTGYFKKNKNIVIIGKEVEKKINELKVNLPNGVIFDSISYQPEDVSKAVNNFILNLLEGIVFVIVVVFIGMGIRNALIVSTAIPLSILMTFCAMYVMGIKIHQISITALIIALGMLVDNAIVVSDSIQVKIDTGIKKINACIDGAKEVAIPVLTSTLTTVGAFIPLLMLPSMAGDYIISIPQIVMLSLTSSYLVALFVTPTMAYIFLKPANKKEKKSSIKDFFEALLSISLKKRKTTILLSLIVLGLTLYFAMKLGLQFFPKADKNIIYLDIRTEQSIDISKTESMADQIAKILTSQPEITSYTEAIGNGLPKFYNTMRPYTESKDFAQILCYVDLTKGDRFKGNTELVSFLQDKIDNEITGSSVSVKELEQGEPIDAPVRLRVSGNDLNRLEKVTNSIKGLLGRIDGTTNINDDFSAKKYEFNIDIDTDKAYNSGISKYDVSKEVNIALLGKKASVYRLNGNEYNIVVKSDISSKQELENLAVKSSYTGNKILLKQFSDVTLTPKNPNIKKYDKEKSVIIYSDVKSGYSSASIQEKLKEKLPSIDLSGVNVTFDGEKEKILENFGDIGFSAIIAILLVYLILLLQFRSFIQPIIILLTIPLSAIGSILGLFIFRQPLSFMALLGIVSLLGIVVNNAIVLIDFINFERKKGISVEEACREATGKRFRPILLSTITTVIGLIPLVFARSEMFTPLAISIMSGLMVSTLLTLVIIPVVYCMVESKIEKIFDMEKKL